jgi:hypothetical protein
MNIQPLAVVCLAAFAASTSASYEGPCSQEITRVGARGGQNNGLRGFLLVGPPLRPER